MAAFVELWTQAVDPGIHLIGNSAQIRKEPAEIAHGIH